MSNTRVDSIRPLIPPMILSEELPITPDIIAFVEESRRVCADILAGRDDRVLVVVGPCSIHDPVAALDYARRLKASAEELKDDIFVVMRVYFEKPRTTVGWKGLINDPGLNDTYEINTGLRKARKLMLEINELGLPCGSELLDTISPQFIADLISWGAIGARTTESQLHRELVSGLSMPVGFKNGSSGDTQIAVDAMQAAASPHVFLGVTEQGLAGIVKTKGNDNCFVILRGGANGPNYTAVHIEKAAKLILSKKNPKLLTSIVVDASHGNSGKDHRKQPLVIGSICNQIALGEKYITGVMLESFLEAGSQKLVAGEADKLVYGKSITDKCIDWDTTVVCLKQLAKASQQRRAANMQAKL